MHISAHLGLPPGHSHFPFVDVTTRSDTRLFLDPCLIERGQDDFSRYSTALISDFEDKLYWDMRHGRWDSTTVFDEAHEINDTKLGYGTGYNGKGKTPRGMRDSLRGLCKLANSIPTISRIQDISVFVEDFAEDCMSDLLTNILRLNLSLFTADLMHTYGKEPAGIHMIKSWDLQTHNWVEIEQPYWTVSGQKILLVPKWWVRKNFLFKAHQYLYGVIIERMKREPGYENLAKIDVWKNMERDSEHWEYAKVIEYTQEHPDALNDYHVRMPNYYNRSAGCMDDNDLDRAVYGRSISAIA